MTDSGGSCRSIRYERWRSATYGDRACARRTTRRIRSVAVAGKRRRNAGELERRGACRRPRLGRSAPVHKRVGSAAPRDHRASGRPTYLPETRTALPAGAPGGVWGRRIHGRRRRRPSRSRSRSRQQSHRRPSPVGAAGVQGRPFGLLWPGPWFDGPDDRSRDGGRRTHRQSDEHHHRLDQIGRSARAAADPSEDTPGHELGVGSLVQAITVLIHSG